MKRFQYIKMIVYEFVMGLVPKETRYVYLWNRTRRASGR